MSDTAATTTPPVIVPDGDKWLVFDGHSWIVYDISGLDDSYRRRNQHEEFHIRFETDRPDGLLWYNGNVTNNVHLGVKVFQRLLSVSVFVLSFVAAEFTDHFVLRYKAVGLLS